MPNVYRPNAYFILLEPDVIFGKLSIYGTWPLCTEIFLLNDIQRVEWEKSSYITSQSRSHSGAESFCWNSIPRPAWLWHSDLELITSPASWPVHSETIRGFKFKILLYNLYYRQRANTLWTNFANIASSIISNGHLVCHLAVQVSLLQLSNHQEKSKLINSSFGWRTMFTQCTKAGNDWNLAVSKITRAKWVKLNYIQSWDFGFNL